jgi:DNA-binding NarL/FixJ family response regulator
MSLCRVLVVEDHEPFRRALCAVLQGLADVVIVGEAADGVDAIHQATALQPDVIALDLGLPTLGGVEVASQLRVVAPQAKILLVTNESSSDVVEEAFRRGAHGYVYKPHLPRDLPRAFDMILGGGQFVGRLERVAHGDTLASHRHDVLFYSSDAVFVSAFSQFIASSLRQESAVIVLVTESHGESLRHGLQLCNVDLDQAIQEGLYIPLNISQMLSKVMVDGAPDPTRFMNAAAEVVAEAAQRAAGQHRKVAACGECSPTLWAKGDVDAAIQLEHLWDEVSRSQQMDIQCAYPMATGDESARAVKRLCMEHTVVEIR